jgi:hypothetical protein
VAAATVASGYPIRTVIGNKRVVIAKLTDPADTNTYDTGLYNIDGVWVSFNDADAVAADGTAYTFSGGTITFEIVGTARDVMVLAIGD